MAENLVAVALQLYVTLGGHFKGLTLPKVPW